jgi:hypothetical protein
MGCGEVVVVTGLGCEGDVEFPLNGIRAARWGSRMVCGCCRLRKLVGGWLGRDGARERGARMGMEGPMGLTVSGLAEVWAEAQVGESQKA